MHQNNQTSNPSVTW